METKNLLNKNFTQWLLLMAMLVGCSANAWAWFSPTHRFYFDASAVASYWNLTNSSYKLYAKVCYNGDGNNCSNVATMTKVANSNYLYYTDSFKNLDNVSHIQVWSGTSTSNYYRGINKKSLSGWENFSNKLGNCCWDCNDTSKDWPEFHDCKTPPLTSISISATSTTYGGDGTSSDPYIVETGTKVTVSATPVKNETSMYAWVNFAIDGTYGSYSYMSSPGKTVVSSAVKGTTYTAQVKGKGCDSNSSNSNISVNSRESGKLYFLAVSKPAMSTNEATSITDAGATLSGKITDDGGKAPTEYGINVYSDLDCTSLVKEYTASNLSSGSFSVVVSDLSANTTYYFKAFATNVIGTTESSSAQSFKTLSDCTPPTITASDPAAICGSDKPEMSASTTAGTIHWYSDASCTSELGTGISYTPSTPINKTTYYYLKAIDGDCESDIKTLTATVNQLPTASISGDDAVCQNGSLQLTGSGGTSYKWNDADYSETSTYNITTTSAGQQTIRLKVKDANNCESAETSKTVTVNEIPSISTIAAGDGNNECGTGNVTFNSTGATSGATIQWYEGLSKLKEGTETSYTLEIAGGSSKTLKAKAVKEGCVSSFTAEATGSRKTAPAISASTTNTTAYEVVTLESTSGSVLLWSKDAADTKAYFVKDQMAVDGNTVEAESVNFKAPAKGDAYTITAKGSDNDCTSNVSITVVAAQETCN